MREEKRRREKSRGERESPVCFSCSFLHDIIHLFVSLVMCNWIRVHTTRCPKYWLKVDKLEGMWKETLVAYI